MLAVDQRIRQKETAANENRQWIRLTAQCNNKCSFCLDTDAHNGTNIEVAAIAAQLRQGIERGATRVVLSGGEPTIHPAYTEIVGEAKKAGYRWIQTVTNGRMFAYPKFARKVREAGLNEATFSMHGHTAALHDMLVGAPGAFEQATAGMRHMMALGAVVNVDVVLTRFNAPVLRELLEFYIAMGVNEFDLLHMIPFGSAWTTGRHLFCDPKEARAAVESVRDLARDPRIYIWCNRLPPPQLEGAEEFIQDPHKMIDEVRGRLREFNRALPEGRMLSCAGERCRFCYLQTFCAKADRVNSDWRAGRIRLTHLNAREAMDPGHGAALAAAARVVLEATRVPEALAALETQTFAPASVIVGLPETLDPGLPDLHALAARPEVLRVRLGRPGAIVRALAETALRVEIILNRLTVAWLRGKDRFGKGRAAWLKPYRERVVLALQERPLVQEVDRHDTSIAALCQEADFKGFATRGIPRCLVDGPSADDSAWPVSLEAFAPGQIEPLAFTESYIPRGYTSKSLRCENCRHNELCDGMSIYYLRKFGFQILRPVPFLPGEARPPARTPGGPPARLVPLPRRKAARVAQSVGYHIDAEASALNLVVRTTCQNRCEFCTTKIIHEENAEPWPVDPIAPLKDAIVLGRAKGLSTLRFVAVEPLEHPDAIELIRFAATRGYAEVEVWSSVRRCAGAAFAAQVVAAGATAVRVPIYGTDAATHDAVAGAPGAFAETLAGIAALRKAGLGRIVLSPRITRRNAAQAAAIIAFVARLECEQGGARMAAPSSADPAYYEPFAPRLSAVAAGLRQASDSGHPFAVLAQSQLARDVPPCVYRAHGLVPADGPSPWHETIPPTQGIRITEHRADGGESASVGFELKQHAPCPKRDACLDANHCAGVFAPYLALFGDDEFKPRRA